MKEKTVCFLVKREGGKVTQVCLGMKKRGFGEGLYAGIGGKIGDKVAETAEEAAIREVEEEIGVKASELAKIGEVTFLFPTKEGWDQLVHVYIIGNWDGELVESEEMKPEWFLVNEVPFEKMWDDAKYWLPEVLAEKNFTACFSYGEDIKVMDKEVRNSNAGFKEALR